LVQRGLQIVDRVIVVLGVNPGKNPMLTADERAGLVQKVFANEPRVTVEVYDGLLVNFLKMTGTRLVLRGLRTARDFEDELTMALTNRKLSPEVETLCLMTEEKDFCTSSTVVRTLYRMGGEFEQFVPEQVAEYLRRRQAKKHEPNPQAT